MNDFKYDGFLPDVGRNYLRYLSAFEAVCILEEKDFKKIVARRIELQLEETSESR